MLYLMKSGCASADYRGTDHHEAKNLLSQYAKERDKTNVTNAGYSHKQHTFVFMTIREGMVPDLEEYVKKHELGSIVMSDVAVNINHSGNWYIKDYYGSKLFAVIYTPNHKNLTDWYIKNIDKAYKLE